MTDLYRKPDDEMRGLARMLLAEAQTAVLSVHDPEAGHPWLSTIAVFTDNDGTPTSLISSLSRHTRLMEQDPKVALLLGRTEAKGDPLTWPRLTLQAEAHFIRRGTRDHDLLARRCLRLRPKTRLYAEFEDFRFVRFPPARGFLNAGFGAACLMEPSDVLENDNED